MSWSVLMKVNNGEVFATGGMGIRYLAWSEWVIGYVLYYALVLALSARYPVIHDFLSLR